MANKIPLEECYDSELLEAAQLINNFFNDIAERMYNRLPYDDWEDEFQIRDELILFAEMIEERQHFNA